MESQTNTSPKQMVLNEIKHQNQLAKCQNGTWCSQTVLNSRQVTEPGGKNAQIALHAHKRSSAVDRHQNQLAKMPKQQAVLRNNPQQQIHIRTNWQNTQIAPHVPNSS